MKNNVYINVQSKHVLIKRAAMRWYLVLNTIFSLPIMNVLTVKIPFNLKKITQQTFSLVTEIFSRITLLSVRATRANAHTKSIHTHIYTCIHASKLHISDSKHNYLSDTCLLTLVQLYRYEWNQSDILTAMSNVRMYLEEQSEVIPPHTLFCNIACPYSSSSHSAGAVRDSLLCGWRC